MRSREPSLSIAVEIHKDRRLRVADEPQGVVITRASFDNAGRAVGLGDEHSRRVVVEHASHQIDRRSRGINWIGGVEAVLNRQGAGIFSHAVIDRFDDQSSPDVLSRENRQAGDGRVEIGRIEHLHLVRRAEAQIDRDRLCGIDREFDLVGIRDLTRGVPFQDSRRVTRLAHQQRSEIVIEDSHFNIRDRDAVKRFLVRRAGARHQQAVADHDFPLALLRIVVSGSEEHRSRNGPGRGGEFQHRGSQPRHTAVDRDQH